MNDNQRIIQLSEVSVNDFPASHDYKYKCNLQVISEEGQSLLSRDLLIRTQPSWLVDLKNKGDCTIAITLRYRSGDITQPWQDAGVVTFATQECLNGERSAELEFPITTWNQAPQLKLKTRLNQSSSEGSSSSFNLLGNQNGTRLYSKGTQTEGESEGFEMPQSVPLLPPEEVIVKDTWNKLRAGKEVQMEKFLKRLLLESPELEYIFGDAMNSMNDFFFELFDCCVHQLQPETQNIIGEPLD